MDKYIHNLSGVTKVYIGEELANNAYMLIDPLKDLKFQEDEDGLITDITAGDALMSRDGAVDLSVADSLIFLQLDDATSLTGIIVNTSTPTNDQALLYNSTSEELEWGSPTGDKNVDGGASASTYLITQNIDGMGA